MSADTLLQNRYKILQPLGQGGMGAVYLAVDTKFNSKVAVKRTLLDTRNDEFREAFVREANLLNKMHHAALSHVIDYFVEGEGQFLVMQFVEGKNLADLLDQRLRANMGAFPYEQVLEWADQLLDALDYLHKQEPSVLHLDIKPQNLILTPKDKVMMVDFGLARIKVSDDSSYCSLAGYTPPYASWEQLSNEAVDQRSDLFSLAATLYHLMAAKLPSTVMTRVSQSHAGTGTDPLEPVNSLNPEIPAEVAIVIHSALALRKENWPSTAAEMRTALRIARQPTVFSNGGNDNDESFDTVKPNNPKPELYPLPPTASQKAEAGAKVAIDIANHWILKAQAEAHPEGVTRYLRLSHIASEIARNLMDTAEKAKRGT